MAIMLMAMVACDYFSGLDAKGNPVCKTPDGLIWLDADMALVGQIYKQFTLDGNYACFRLNGDFDGDISQLSSNDIDITGGRAACAIRLELPQ